MEQHEHARKGGQIRLNKFDLVKKKEHREQGSSGSQAADNKQMDPEDKEEEPTSETMETDQPKFCQKKKSQRAIPHDLIQETQQQVLLRANESRTVEQKNSNQDAFVGDAGNRNIQPLADREPINSMDADESMQIDSDIPGHEVQAKILEIQENKEEATSVAMETDQPDLVKKPVV